VTARIVRRLKCERGQAFVEFALILPVFVGFIFAVAWVGVGFYRYLQLADAAQSAARAGSVARFAPGNLSPCDAAEARIADIGVWAVQSCNNAAPGEDFSVTVAYDYDLHFPFFNELSPAVHMERTVHQRVE
jgi:hypothetical protein